MSISILSPSLPRSPPVCLSNHSLLPHPHRGETSSLHTPVSTSTHRTVTASDLIRRRKCRTAPSSINRASECVSSSTQETKSSSAAPSPRSAAPRRRRRHGECHPRGRTLTHSHSHSQCPLGKIAGQSRRSDRPRRQQTTPPRWRGPSSKAAPSTAASPSRTGASPTFPAAAASITRNRSSCPGPPHPPARSRLVAMRGAPGLAAAIPLTISSRGGRERRFPRLAGVRRGMRRRGGVRRGARMRGGMCTI